MGGTRRKSFVSAGASWDPKYSSQNEGIGPKDVEEGDENDKRAYSGAS